MRCVEVRQELPAYVRDGSPSLTMRRHLMECPECREELARYESLLGSLSELRSVSAEVPRRLTEVLVAIPESATVGAAVRDRAETAWGHVSRNRAAYLGGAAALAFGLAGPLCGAVVLSVS